MNWPMAASCTAWPPATEPVKLTCWMRPEPISVAVCSWSSTRLWNSPAGNLARWKASAKRSPTSSVWLACLSSTALPAISAGITEFTAVR
ncbi:hypothetical protein D3C81_1313250 [compost metagenome]